MKDVEKIVRRCLMHDERMRESDDLLYLGVMAAKGVCPYELTVQEMFRTREQLGIPPFETVRRTRQKVMADTPELRGKNYVERMRKQKDYKNYALSE